MIKRRSPAERQLWWACISAGLAGMNLILATRDLLREDEERDAQSVVFAPPTSSPAVTPPRYDSAAAALADVPEPVDESGGQVPGE